MTTTDAPEPEPSSSGDPMDDFIKNAKIEMSPEALDLMRTAIQRWSKDKLSQSLRATLVRSSLKDLDSGKIPDEKIPEVTAQALEQSLEDNHVLDDKATASEKRAKVSLRVAVVSTIIAALALLGALPQGIAALPAAVAVLNGTAWQTPPAPATTPGPAPSPAATP